MQLGGSIRRRKMFRYSHSLLEVEMPTSTPPPLIVMVCSGLQDKAASMVVLSQQPETWKSIPRRAAAARMALQLHPTVRSTMHHWQTAMSVVLIHKLAKQPFLSLQLRVRARGASGPIRREGFGSVSGMRVRSQCTIPQITHGANGNCLVTAPKPTLFMWTI